MSRVRFGGFLLLFLALTSGAATAQNSVSDLETYINERFQSAVNGVVAIHLSGSTEDATGFSALQLSPVSDEMLSDIYNEVTGSSTPTGQFGITRETIHDKLLDKVNRTEGIGLVYHELPDPAEITGTGFLVGRDGYILTIGKLFDSYMRPPNIRVTFSDGYSTSAQLHGIDHHTNIAVLRCEDPHGQPLSLGDSRALKVGSSLVAVTCPYGLPPSAHFGYVSGLKRKIGPPDAPGTRYERYVQTDLPLHPGAHGGPVMDRSGKVIGMLAATVKLDAWREISFVIPSEILEPISREIIEQGSVARGFLGVSLVQETPSDITLANPGVLIGEVAPDSPAERAGIYPGDRILRVGEDATDNADDFVWAIAGRKPGETVELSIFRQGSLVQVPVTLSRAEQD